MRHPYPFEFPVLSDTFGLVERTELNLQVGICMIRGYRANENSLLVHLVALMGCIADSLRGADV